MIHRKATIKYKGYDPLELTKGQQKRVCMVCDNCGRVRWGMYQSYRSLCGSCSKLGRLIPNEMRKKISKGMMGLNKGENNPMFGKRGELSPNWKGGFDKNRNHVLPERDCIKLNSRFKGSEMHHITKSIVVYIPYELHNHIDHNMKTGHNMGSMNMLALQFINGEL